MSYYKLVFADLLLKQKEKKKPNICLVPTYVLGVVSDTILNSWYVMCHLIFIKT